MHIYLWMVLSLWFPAFCLSIPSGVCSSCISLYLFFKDQPTMVKAAYLFQQKRLPILWELLENLFHSVTPFLLCACLMKWAIAESVCVFPERKLSLGKHYKKIMSKNIVEFVFSWNFAINDHYFYFYLFKASFY